jgi:hypothetical protein
MLKRFLRLKVAVPVAALALAGTIIISIPVAKAFTPPDFDDALTFMVDLRGFRRLTGTTWSCGGGCRASRAGGVAPRGCMIYGSNVTATASVITASGTCATALAAACDGAAVDLCASGERF